VDAFAANSAYIARRIMKVYRREAEVIYPPVAVQDFELGEKKEDFYLTASRMVPYKRIDLIAEAFSRIPEKRLIIIGDGPEMESIRAKAGSNVSLLGYRDNPTLRSHLQRARAFVFAAEEDFGILPVEAQACGTPVIAFCRGGVAETVNPGETGVLFLEQSVESLVDAVRQFEKMTFTPAAIRRQAEKFSAEVFRKHFADFVRSNCKGWEASLGL
jgi:O-antigen biosynthesis alpha-1,3-mannosyltransferase